MGGSGVSVRRGVQYSVFSGSKLPLEDWELLYETTAGTPGSFRRLDGDSHYSLQLAYTGHLAQFIDTEAMKKGGFVKLIGRDKSGGGQ